MASWAFGLAALAAIATAAVEEPITVQGRAVCLDPEGVAISDAADARCDDPASGVAFALRTGSGELYRFLADDPQAGMMVDPRVRARTLSVTGWRRGEDALEILHVYSIREGRLHDIHYRCDVCNITATAPGPCWCCGQDFELREEPVATLPGAGGRR